MESFLVVDDNDVFRERLARGLERRGHTVFRADGYDTALHLVREQRPQQAVVDLKMPGKNGLELVRDALQLLPELRMVVLTGYGSIATAIEAIHLGAVSYLSKPADIDEILQAFRQEGRAASEQHEFDPPTLPRVEWEHIQRVLHDCDNNVSEAARRLDIDRRTLQRKLKKYAPKEKIFLVHNNETETR